MTRVLVELRWLAVTFTLAATVALAAYVVWRVGYAGATPIPADWAEAWG